MIQLTVKFPKQNIMNIIKKIFLQIFNLVIAQKYWYASKNRQKSQNKNTKNCKNQQTVRKKSKKD